MYFCSQLKCMKNFILTSLIYLFYSFSVAYAQENKTDSIEPLKIEIVKDSRVDKLNESYTSTFKLEGYRIQIASDNKKQPAREARMEFSKIYRTIKAYEIYEQPYFKVRVGDFKTKIEALKFRNDLIKHFPNSFIVKDFIEF